MSEENKAVVTLHKGVNADEFLNNMTTAFGSDSIPARSITLHNEKLDSISNFDFVLTKEEAETLKNAEVPKVLFFNNPLTSNNAS